MSTIAIIGSGYMGGGIAQLFAIGGHEVRIADVSADVTATNLVRIRQEAAAFEAEGLLPAGSTAAVEARVHAAGSLEEAVAGADLVEEAVIEVLAVKHDVLGRASRANETATIASNTSTISIAAIAEGVHLPERFLGVHFSNPAPFIPGVEVIPHAGTQEERIVQAEELVRGIGKTTARVGDVTGFVLNRLQYALFHEATQLVEEGVASVEDIDTVVRTTFGYRLPFFGPFAIADMAGLDVYNFCYGSLQGGFPERFATPAALTDLVAAGRLGVKAGGGFRELDAERTAELVAYRNKAYVAMQALLDELGPSPFDAR
ncbi:3-hydroxyacyl-CoA dehydrogenase [Serinibacter arcticus]|uniref:3-hydroxyacyl-CoA dehydrogenase n=1 Tax=Serinibacter arcticus TaxID=1655435 RepID=A0A2U1ZW27_9MICO|nr:3-hydroxyacyl-CoA dehydrogenase family protein [Serinibacter arcticus]PWD51195.1 3-hydroxyacyl-CoA dehydrogenase [Serinibacter arcticus]